jgi:hypothetical protein
VDWIDIAKWLCISVAVLVLLGGATVGSLAWFLNHAD